MSSEKEKKGRKELTLKEQVDVIEYSKKSPGLGSRNIASVFKFSIYYACQTTLNVFSYKYNLGGY